MVATISPLVKEAPRQWFVSVGAFLLGSGVSAGAAGLLLGWAGGLLQGPDAAGLPALGVAAIGLMLVEVSPSIRHVPSLGGSVPREWWVRFGPTVGALAYGGVLGLGVTTVVPLAAFYILPLSALLMGPPAGAVLGSAYGLSRAVPVLVASVAIACGADPARVGDWATGKQSLVAKRVAAMALLAIGAPLLVSFAWNSALRVL